MTTCYKCPGYDDPGCCVNLARLKDPGLLLDFELTARRYAVVPPTPAGNRQERRVAASKARKGRP